jgi:uncharacterized membrane protein YadS
MVLNSYTPGVKQLGGLLSATAKTTLTLTLFLIGAGLTRQVFLSVGLRPFLQAVVLWIAISVTALYAVMHLAR